MDLSERKSGGKVDGTGLVSSAIVIFSIIGDEPLGSTMRTYVLSVCTSK
jgi:hypothetical protein